MMRAGPRERADGVSITTIAEFFMNEISRVLALAAAICRRLIYDCV